MFPIVKKFRSKKNLQGSIKAILHIMLRIEHIALLQFKNYTQKSFDFTEKIVGICGKNGAGKTNLLDAIHYLCFTKSYFSRQDAGNTQTGKSGFRVEGTVVLNDRPEKAVCILRETGKKEFSVNDEPYEKFSHHIGRYPCVVIAPDDAALITSGSAERRKFLDALLSQLDATYLQQLIYYTKILQQRNSLLKSFNETGTRNMELLDVLDKQLVLPGEYILNKRKEFLVSFLPAVKHLYDSIAGGPGSTKVHEDINLFYESELLQFPFAELLKANRSNDCFAMRTTSGIHKDDLDLQFGEQVFRNIASQGQRKSLLFALKLAEMSVLKTEKRFAPLLLLDDVFEKLDEERVANLFHKVCVENEGQVFITDTNEERLSIHLKKVAEKYQLIRL